MKSELGASRQEIVRHKRLPLVRRQQSRCSGIACKPIWRTGSSYLRQIVAW